MRKLSKAVFRHKMLLLVSVAMVALLVIVACAEDVSLGWN